MTNTVTGLPSPKDLETADPSAVYLLPRAFVTGPLAEQLIDVGQAMRLCGMSLGFSALEVVIRGADSVVRHTASVTAFDPWRYVLPVKVKDHVASMIENLSQPRAPFAGLDLNSPKIMGVVNVTPDSFSDGGDHCSPDAAIAHGLRLAEAGASILDVGGESTRPGADPIDPEEEQRRTLPVVRGLAEKGLTVSIDTRHASTMAAALDTGAAIVNDVTALAADPDSLNLVTKRQVPTVLMHMQGQPRTMQSDPSYVWAPTDVFDVLAERLKACSDAGMDKSLLCVDPGIGFGKNDNHNLTLIDALALLHGLGCPILLGASRKSFIGRISGTKEPKDRLGGSIAAVLAGATQGVQIFRVHDVKDTYQALNIAQALSNSDQ